MPDRKERVGASAVPNTKGAAIMPHVQEKVLPETTVYTEEWRVYNNSPRKAIATATLTTPKKPTGLTMLRKHDRGLLVLTETRDSGRSSIRYPPSTYKAT